MSTENHTYDASHIQVLEGLEAVRKRPGMYIGSTGERGLHHMAHEVACHLMNEVLAGNGSRVDVTVLSDGGLRVRSNGSTDPADLWTVLSEFSFGYAGKLRRNEIVLRFPGMLCAVNALSARLEFEVQHDGIRWAADFIRGRTATPLTQAGPAHGSATVVTFWPDPEIFDTTDFSYEILADAFGELAFLYRELNVTLIDERGPGEPRSRVFEGGLQGLLALLDGEKVLDPVTFRCDDSRMPGELEVALRWRPGGGKVRAWSFANGYRTEGGGTHEKGLRRGLRSAVNSYARQRRLLPVGAPEVSWDGVSDGLTAVVSVKLDEHLVLEGSCRERLANPAVATCVEDAVREHVTAWLESHPAEAEALLARTALGADRS
ncbi:DNA gyrase subunit B [Kitasatospora sp. NPDC051853]|uniref:DNA gyrase subunit B n=1 Tax=Kitasatospora sp. NPDC051853 TaxID=3364058 RepID=UPI003795337E